MNEPEELQRVAESLWSFLQTVGFVPGGEHAAWTGKVYSRSWTRGAGWKRDVVECHCRPKPSSVSLGASWMIPGPEDGDAVLVSAINSAHFFRGWPEYSVPVRLPMLGRFFEGRWLSHLLEDAKRSVQWLDECASRPGALAELERTDRNGPGRGTPIYQWVQRYIHDNAG